MFASLPSRAEYQLPGQSERLYAHYCAAAGKLLSKDHSFEAKLESESLEIRFLGTFFLNHYIREVLNGQQKFDKSVNYIWLRVGTFYLVENQVKKHKKVKTLSFN
jgi:hypothetical protein